MRNNAFGPLDDMPPELSGQDIEFRFESPLHDAIEREKAQTFAESRDMVMAATELDPSAIHNLDVVEALRDALSGLKAPAKWVRDEKDVITLVESDQAAAQQQQDIERQAQESALIQQDEAATQSILATDAMQ